MADPPLAEFVAAVSIAESESAAAVAGVDRAAEALDAVVAAIVCHGEIIAAIEYPDATAPSDELEAVQPGSKGHPSTCPASARARRRLLRSSIRPAPRSGSRERSWPWREQQQESAVGAAWTGWRSLGANSISRPLLPPLTRAAGVRDWYGGRRDNWLTGGSAEGCRPRTGVAPRAPACVTRTNLTGERAPRFRFRSAERRRLPPGRHRGASRRSSDPSSYRNEPFEPSRQKRIGREVGQSVGPASMTKSAMSVAISGASCSRNR